MWYTVKSQIYSHIIVDLFLDKTLRILWIRIWGLECIKACTHCPEILSLIHIFEVLGLLWPTCVMVIERIGLMSHSAHNTRWSRPFYLWCWCIKWLENVNYSLMNGYIGTSNHCYHPKKKTDHSWGPHPVTMLVQHSHCLFCDYIKHITKSIGQ